MVVYEDGTQAKVGDVVMGDGRPIRYLVIGFDGHSAKLILIGTVVVPVDSPQFGKTIISPNGTTRTVPVNGFTRLGYADITVVNDLTPTDVGEAE